MELSQLEGDLNLVRDILSEAKVQVEAWGGKLHFVYLPLGRDNAQRPVIEVKARTRTLSLVSTLGIPMIDATAAFQAQRDPLSLFPFRERGQRTKLGIAWLPKKNLILSPPEDNATLNALRLADSKDDTPRAKCRLQASRSNLQSKDCVQIDLLYDLVTGKEAGQ